MKAKSNKYDHVKSKLYEPTASSERKKSTTTENVNNNTSKKTPDRKSNNNNNNLPDNNNNHNNNQSSNHQQSIESIYRSPKEDASPLKIDKNADVLTKNSNVNKTYYSIRIYANNNNCYRYNPFPPTHTLT